MDAPFCDLVDMHSAREPQMGTTSEVAPNTDDALGQRMSKPPKGRKLILERLDSHQEMLL